MSKLACVVPDKDFLTLGYPPVKPTKADLSKESQAQKILAAAPFGKVKGKAVTRDQYQLAMRAEQRKASSLDFRWPFWVGLGAASLGFVVLLAKKT